MQPHLDPVKHLDEKFFWQNRRYNRKTRFHPLSVDSQAVLNTHRKL